MKQAIIFGVLLVIFLYGCSSGFICEAPYIQVGEECCLDADDNNICDKDEQFEEGSTIIIKEGAPPLEREVKKFVCPDGNLVDDISKCKVEEEDPEPDLAIPPLVTDNEVNTVIDEVRVETACRDGNNGGLIYIKVGTVPSEMVFQIKELPDTEYKDVYKRTGLYDGFIYFVISEKEYARGGDFRLEPRKAYILRILFNQSAVYSALQYSNEHLIDTRSDSEYMLKSCRG
jgi:hypothetical protein